MMRRLLEHTNIARQTLARPRRKKPSIEQNYSSQPQSKRIRWIKKENNDSNIPKDSLFPYASVPNLVSFAHKLSKCQKNAHTQLFGKWNSRWNVFVHMLNCLVFIYLFQHILLRWFTWDRRNETRAQKKKSWSALFISTVPKWMHLIWTIPAMRFVFS